MLWIPPFSNFNWEVDNWGETYTDAGLGTNVPGHANANTKGANTALLAGIAEDAYGILIGMSGGNTTTAIRRQYVDILVDPAAGVGNAGSSWSVAIPNLYANSPCIGTSGAIGYWYYFPMFFSAGTAIGAAHQDLVATTQALRVFVRLNGKPSRPDMVKTISKVEAIGLAASTSGTAVTPGTSVMGSYSASLGTVSFDSWWWQLGIGSADTSMTARSYVFDVAVNDTNKIRVMDGMSYGVVGTIEQAYKACFGKDYPVASVQAGENVYVRGASIGGAPDSSMTCVVYAGSG